MHHVWRDVLDARDDDVREDEHYHSGESHHQAVGGAGGSGQGRTHTEHQDERRVLLYDAIDNDIKLTHLLPPFLLGLWLLCNRQRLPP